MQGLGSYNLFPRHKILNLIKRKDLSPGLVTVVDLLYNPELRYASQVYPKRESQAYYYLNESFIPAWALLGITEQEVREISLSDNPKQILELLLKREEKLLSLIFSNGERTNVKLQQILNSLESQDRLYQFALAIQSAQEFMRDLVSNPDVRQLFGEGVKLEKIVELIELSNLAKLNVLLKKLFIRLLPVSLAAAVMIILAIGITNSQIYSTLSDFDFSFELAKPELREILAELSCLEESYVLDTHYEQGDYLAHLDYLLSIALTDAYGIDSCGLGETRIRERNERIWDYQQNNPQMYEVFTQIHPDYLNYALYFPQLNPNYIGSTNSILELHDEYTTFRVQVDGIAEAMDNSEVIPGMLLYRNDDLLRMTTLEGTFAIPIGDNLTTIEELRALFPEGQIEIIAAFRVNGGKSEIDQEFGPNRGWENGSLIFPYQQERTYITIDTQGKLGVSLDNSQPQQGVAMLRTMYLPMGEGRSSFYRYAVGNGLFNTFVEFGANASQRLHPYEFIGFNQEGEAFWVSIPRMVPLQAEMWYTVLIELEGKGITNLVAGDPDLLSLNFNTRLDFDGTWYEFGDQDSVYNDVNSPFYPRVIDVEDAYEVLSTNLGAGFILVKKP